MEYLNNTAPKGYLVVVKLERGAGVSVSLPFQHQILHLLFFLLCNQ